MIARSALSRLWLAAVLVAVAAGCGLKVVELLPPAAEDDDVIVLGEVPAAALAQLRAHRTRSGEQEIEWLYPQPPELVIPANLAATTLEWRAMPKPKMAMPKAKAPVAGKSAPRPQPAAAGMVAPPLPPPPAAEPAAAAMSDPRSAEAAAMQSARAGEDPIVAYELRAHSELADLRLYVAAPTAAFPSERWQTLLRQHAGARLGLELRGVRLSGVFVHAAPLTIEVRAALPAGDLYSFSTTAQTLMRAKLSDTHEQIVRAPASSQAQDGQRCIGCHAVSRDGRRVLASVAGQGTLLGWSVVDAFSVRFGLPEAGPLDYTFASFDPSASRVAATLAGRLHIFDADTGELLAQSPAPLEAAVSAPDWSPDGRSIVVGMQSGAGGPDAAGLATLRVGLDGSVSALQSLLTVGKDETLRAPSYSPYGDWLVYERRMGPGEGKESRLAMVRASGGAPIELRALMAGAKAMDGASNPVFVPGDQPDRAYVLFSARRAVGSFVPAEGQRQLFGAAIDLSRAQAGEDPSHAAFWLPFQQRTSSYLRVQWAPAPATCVGAADAVEVCDGDDNDCDGDIDEDCCVAASEKCGDDADNDCDGASDEGCDCAFMEVCANQTDDDCDLRTDEKPCMPAPPMR
jgi:hypothetical protein